MSKKKPVRYPWSKWFSKGKFHLRRGKHFQCATYCMAGQIRNAAPKWGVAVSIRVKGDALTAAVRVI